MSVFQWFSYLNWRVLKKIAIAAGEQRLPGLSAEMAYNATLALFPAILAILTAINRFVVSDSLFNYLVRWLDRVAPQEAMALILGFAKEVRASTSESLLSISFLGSIWAASAAISTAMVALDHIHQIPPDKTRPFWKTKMVSLVLTLSIMVLFIIAAFLVFISDWLVHVVASQSCWLEGRSVQDCSFANSIRASWRLLSWPMALGIVVAALSFLYRLGPSRWQPGTPILPGALVAALAWAGLSALFRFYVGQFGHYNKVYGAFGTVIILLLWLYLTSLMMLLGSQINVTLGQARQER